MYFVLSIVLCTFKCTLKSTRCTFDNVRKHDLIFSKNEKRLLCTFKFFVWVVVLVPRYMHSLKSLIWYCRSYISTHSKDPRPKSTNKSISKDIFKKVSTKSWGAVWYGIVQYYICTVWYGIIPCLQRCLQCLRRVTDILVDNPMMMPNFQSTIIETRIDRISDSILLEWRQFNANQYRII
jgi:hypothetical protein